MHSLFSLQLSHTEIPFKKKRKKILQNFMTLFDCRFQSIYATTSWFSSFVSLLVSSVDSRHLKSHENHFLELTLFIYLLIFIGRHGSPPVVVFVAILCLKRTALNVRLTDGFLSEAKQSIIMKSDKGYDTRPFPGNLSCNARVRLVFHLSLLLSDEDEQNTERKKEKFSQNWKALIPVKSHSSPFNTQNALE